MITPKEAQILMQLLDHMLATGADCGDHFALVIWDDCSAPPDFIGTNSCPACAAQMLTGAAEKIEATPELADLKTVGNA
jgi:hypothetical protein